MWCTYCLRCSNYIKWQTKHVSPNPSMSSWARLKSNIFSIMSHQGEDFCPPVGQQVCRRRPRTRALFNSPTRELSVLWPSSGYLKKQWDDDYYLVNYLPGWWLLFFSVDCWLDWSRCLSNDDVSLYVTRLVHTDQPAYLLMIFPIVL